MLHLEKSLLNFNKKTVAKSCCNGFLLFVHSVSDTKLVNDVFCITGVDSELFADICHIDLKLFDASAVGGFAPNRFDYCRVGYHFAAMF